MTTHPHPPTPSRRSLLRALAIVPAAALVLGEAPDCWGARWPPRPPAVPRPGTPSSRSSTATTGR
ncbi:hypothetical protein F3K43_39000 [Streptomyces sp. LBUM 1476]|nr:hypothetical protein [Streptomyces sp. LBUM 1476]